MRLSQLLFSQGFGTRRECEGLALSGEVRIAGRVVDDPDEEFDEQGLSFQVGRTTWPYRERALIILNKPAGYECSLKPKAWPGVQSLLPPPLRRRGLQPVGRLDQDTTGLLLMTDDGQLLHKLTSPKHKVPKVYDATTKHPFTVADCEKLMKGVVLDDDPAPVFAEGAELLDEHHLRLTLIQGKYHQVKRMIAACGNRCEALNRVSFGPWVVPEDLPLGAWVWADPH